MMKVNDAFLKKYSKYMKKVGEQGNLLVVESKVVSSKKSAVVEKKQDSNHELRKYKGNNPLFGSDYIVGRAEDFSLAHNKGGSLEGEQFELIETYESFGEFKTKRKELLDSFYSDRIYKGESFSLYALCEDGVIAGF